MKQSKLHRINPNKNAYGQQAYYQIDERRK
jgi:hypothetical protein